VSPLDAVTGFPPGQVLGTVHAADANAAQAQSDLTIAYNDAAGRPSSASAGVFVNETLLPGVYTAGSALALNGALTLDGQGNANSVFIFQAGSTLTTASGSSIVLTNGAQACNIFWQVGSSATLGTGTSFKGNILALTSISVTTGVTIEGRALARNGSVTLDSNVFTAPGCAATPTGTSTVTPTQSATGTPIQSTTALPTQTATAAGTATQSATLTPTSTGTPALSGTTTTQPTTSQTSGAPLETSATTPANGSPLADTGTGAARNNGVNIDSAANAPATSALLVGVAAALTALAAAIYLGWSLLIPARRRAD
jgi:type VI secretion system secreted protein VgrG